MPQKLNYQQMYEGLRDGTIQPEEVSVRDLFEIASRRAVSGDVDFKNRVFDSIYVHRDANTIDKARVEVHRFDLMRRAGDAAGALEGLEKIKSFGVATLGAE